MPVETPDRIEPCLPEDIPAGIANLVADLSGAARELGARLNPRTAASIADFVRIMNCYYSNLIEGHNTRPRDIERALADDLDAETRKRNLQVEARAHIRVQAEVDRLHAAGTLPDPVTPDFIQWLHAEFYRDAPEEMLLIEGPRGLLRMRPGVFRATAEEEVEVGRHLPPASDRVPAFMERFYERYRADRIGTGMRIVAMAAAHHRLNYIHPFVDGNGRVSRLMSHAMGLTAGIGAHGLWSVSRGLARGLENPAEYRQWMDHADMPRQGDYDGHGNLSQRALLGFIEWFLKVCLDQVGFMTAHFELKNLSDRLAAYAAFQGWKPEARYLLEEALIRGEVVRGDAPRITGLKERAARLILAGLTEDGILASETPKGPVSLRFPIRAADILFPRLFTEA